MSLRKFSRRTSQVAIVYVIFVLFVCPSCTRSVLFFFRPPAIFCCDRQEWQSLWVFLYVSMSTKGFRNFHVHTHLKRSRLRAARCWLEGCRLRGKSVSMLHGTGSERASE